MITEPLPLVFMFPGLGSQYPMMGSELYERDARFRAHMERLEEIARETVHASILDTLYSRREPEGPLDDSILSGVAIVAIELALSRRLIEAGILPAAIVGSSSGLCAACAAADSLSDEQVLKLAFLQQRIVRDTCDAGRMITVLADPAVYYRSEVLSNRSEIAAINYGTSFVIALPEASFSEVRACLEKQKRPYHVLPVRRPYHSRWIDEAREPIRLMTEGFRFAHPRVPILCCSQAGRIEAIDSQTCWRAIRGRLRFRDTVREMEKIGHYRYIDAGPSGTLANFLKQCLPPQSGSVVHSIVGPFKRGCENIESLTRQLSGCGSGG